MEAFLDGKYDFRYNRLTEEAEYRRRMASRGQFKPLDQRALNSFCIEARKKGIDCWDRDISRYVYSKNVVEYHPFQLFLDELPEWDGVERVEALAARVSVSPLWVSVFAAGCWGWWRNGCRWTSCMPTVWRLCWSAAGRDGRSLRFANCCCRKCYSIIIQIVSI